MCAHVLLLFIERHHSYTFCVVLVYILAVHVLLHLLVSMSVAEMIRQGSKRLDSRMSPHAAKARGISDRGGVAPMGGHEGMPEDTLHQGLLEDEDLMGSAPGADENSDGLISELSLFDAGATEVDGGGAPESEDLAMLRLVRSASMSSTGSGDAEDSEVKAI